jgi:hypothetical protein
MIAAPYHEQWSTGQATERICGGSEAACRCLRLRRYRRDFRFCRQVTAVAQASMPTRQGERADLCAAQPPLDGHFSGSVDAVFQLGKDSGMIAPGSRIRMFALIRP